MLESELWRDDNLYDLLQLRNQKHVDLQGLTVTTICCTELVIDTHENHPLVKDGEACGIVHRVIDILVAKIRVLAFLRLKDMTQKLDMPEQISERVWMAVEHVLNVEHVVRLLYERHLDLIILCSLFAVARMADVALTFAEIRNVYQTQPHFLAEVVDCIKMPIPNPSKPQGMDLIMYYNHVYLPAMKSFIAQDVASRKTGQTPMKRGDSGLRMTLLTPARSSNRIMTPVTKKLYHSEIVGSSTPKPSPFNLPMPSSSRRR
jgi:hypothetical protein